MKSITPSIAGNNIPSDVKNVNYTVTITGYNHYDAISGKYVSSSSPTVTINYMGRVGLTLDSCTTSYHDNGNDVTFSFSGKLRGNINSDAGVYCTINYGTINGSYTVKK